MGKMFVFIGGNINPEIYQKVRQKFPKMPDTQMISDGLELLFNDKVSDKNIDLSKLKQEIWDEFVEKCKSTDKPRENVVGMLIYRFIKEK